MNIINSIMGDLSEKKKYRENEKRAKALPAQYAAAYKEIKHYLWNTAGIITIEPLVSLVDMLEEAAAEGRQVTDITGPDVAAFADELARGAVSYKDSLSKKLNDRMNKKG